MIISLATEVTKLVAEFKRLQINATQVTTIQATAADLETLRSMLSSWVIVFPSIEPYLEAEQRNSLYEQAASLHRRIHESRDKFQTDSNQHSVLVRIQGSIRTLMEETQRGWTQYALGKLQVPRERTRFARLLPHMQDTIPAINSYLADLERLAGQFPGRVREVSDFHARLAQLEEMLRNMAGMNPTQTAFLTKLGDNAATLADLSSELLEWCQREDLAPLLKIRL